MAATITISCPGRFPSRPRKPGCCHFWSAGKLFAGAGKSGIEAQETAVRRRPYQLSQRADFMETELSVDTMHNRPIVNTRDEPHADRA